MSPITRNGTPSRIVVMGVSGCGKTSIGTLLGRQLGLEFKDGDDLHPQSNKNKMSSGIPLTDEDRWPWLDLVALTLQMPGGAVVACSALKRQYRDRIRASAPDTVFIHLSGDRDLLMQRLGNRKNHFMPASLLDPQLATLEPLGDDEVGMTVNVGGDELEILNAILSQVTVSH